MSKFNISKNKISKIWNDTTSTSDSLDKKLADTQAIEKLQEAFHNFHTQLQSVRQTNEEWIFPTAYTDLNQVANRIKASMWEITLVNIPAFIIPFIRPQFAWRLTGDQSETLPTSTLIKKTMSYQSTPSSLDPDLINLTIRAGIEFQNGSTDLPDNLQVQLLIVEVNPNLNTTA